MSSPVRDQLRARTGACDGPHAVDADGRAGDPADVILGGAVTPEKVPYFDNGEVVLRTGDATAALAALPDRSVDCVVTSPPYWRLRDYGTAFWTGGDPTCPHRLPGTRADRSVVWCYCGARRHDHQYGLEAAPEKYVARLREVFAQLSRVLVESGTVWLNLGDSYGTRPVRSARPVTVFGGAGASVVAGSRSVAGTGPGTNLGSRRGPKSLLGMPWRVATALQDDGWVLRNAIVWHKPNAMPESVQDRLSVRYEMLFLLTRAQGYYFDLDAIREPLARSEALREGLVIGGARKGRHGGIEATARRRGHSVYGRGSGTMPTRGTTGEGAPASVRGRNPGDVWSISTRPLREAHFAAFPIDLPLRAIAAGCPPGGVVLDPFSGAGTTGLAARQLGRHYLGIDLRPDFHDITLRRLGLHHDVHHDAQGDVPDDGQGDAWGGTDGRAAA